MRLRNELIDKKEELMQMKDNLFSVQKTLSEKEIILQETNTRLAEQIPKISSESEVLEGVSRLEKDNGITSPEIIPKLPNSVFFQLAIFLIILLLIIYFLKSIFSYLYSFIPSFN